MLFFILQAEENIDAPVVGSVGLVDGKGSLNSNVGKSRKKKENLTVPGLFLFKYLLLEL